jgi:hypothetical protein
VVLLRVPRQDRNWRGLSPMIRVARPVNLWIRRATWLIAIWIASVAALAVAASLLRLLMTLCGMKG